MTRETPILKSKIRPPVRSKSIGRTGLHSLSETILDKRLTTVTAGAGYGKTTLIAQALKGLDDRLIWYRLDSSDEDLSTFLSYLATGIRKIFPNFSSNDALDRLQESVGDNGGETYIRWMLAELENYLNTELVLVFDNFHWVQGSDTIKKVLNFFLRYAPSALHVVLISRRSIPLSLSRLKAQQQLLELTSTDLVFSREETALLCSEIFQVHWDRDLLDRMHDLTEGWISGLALFHHAFHDLSRDDVLEFLDQSHSLPDSVSDYLEEEVFSPLVSEVKDFLLQTSILTRLRASFCDKWLEIDASQRILTHLAKNHLFLEKDGVEGGGYVYHNLFRIFLHKKLATLSSPETIVDLHRKAAVLFEGIDEIEEALTHFLVVADFKDIVGLLNTAGMRLFQEGKYEILKACLDKTPQKYIDDFPWVQCLYGKLHGVYANHAAATQSYGRALVIFEQQGDREGVNLCQIEIALNYFLAGQFTEAAQVLEKLLLQPSISDELRIEALGYLIYITTHLRHKDSWTHFYAITRSVLEGLDSATLSNRLKVWLDTHRGYACIAIGDYQKALELGRSVEWHAQQLDERYDFFGHYALLASACYFLQRFEEGLAYARKGLANLAQENPKKDLAAPTRQPARSTPAGVRDRGWQDTALPTMLLQAARNAFGLGQTEESIAYAKQSITLFRSIGVKWGQAMGLSMLCTAYAHQGDTVLAEQSALSGMRLLKGLDLPLTKGALMGNLAVALMMAKRFEEALPLIRDAEKAFTPIGMSYWIDLWLAMYHWHQDRERGRAEFLAVLSFCAEKQNYSIVAERHWIVPFLVDTYARGHLRNYIFNMLRKIGSDAILDLKQLLRDSRDAALKRVVHGLLRDLPKPDPPGLKIYLLGRFRVFVGDQKVHADKWGNQKVRSLFQYLAYSWTQGYVNRDVLIEMLWPDQDPTKTMNRFHVTMTTLRRVLETDLPDGAPSSYISRVGDTYRIELGKEGWVDMHAFADDLTRASQEKDPHRAVRHSLDAVATYTGDLLAEAPFCEWCRDIRRNLRKKYLDALETIITYYETLREFEKSIVYTEKYLSLDKTAEKMYRKLMGYYAKTDNPIQIASTLERCRENLRIELDCPIEPQTEELARQLLGAENYRAVLK